MVFEKVRVDVQKVSAQICSSVQQIIPVPLLSVVSIAGVGPVRTPHNLPNFSGHGGPSAWVPIRKAACPRFSVSLGTLPLKTVIDF
jgi:hypothetical protein